MLAIHLTQFGEPEKSLNLDPPTRISCWSARLLRADQRVLGQG